MLVWGVGGWGGGGGTALLSKEGAATQFLEFEKGQVKIAGP